MITVGGSRICILISPIWLYLGVRCGFHLHFSDDWCRWTSYRLLLVPFFPLSHHCILAPLYPLPRPGKVQPLTDSWILGTQISLSWQFSATESVALYRLSVFLADLTSQLSTSSHTTLQPDWQSQTLSESLNLCRYSSLCMGCYAPLPHPTWLTSVYHSPLRSYVTSPRKSCLMLPPPPPTRLGGLPLVCG